MANMSYCRFENTARDLGDCVRALLQGETEDLSHYELNGLAKILEYAHDIVESESYIYEILDDNN
tara:strand:+ start:392 stop:586 length:195 start_codon:yes stop_codon:yes gene_type:complete